MIDNGNYEEHEEARSVLDVRIEEECNSSVRGSECSNYFHFKGIIFEKEGWVDLAAKEYEHSLQFADTIESKARSLFRKGMILRTDNEKKNDAIEFKEIVSLSSKNIGLFIGNEELKEILFHSRIEYAKYLYLVEDTTIANHRARGLIDSAISLFPDRGLGYIARGDMNWYNIMEDKAEDRVNQNS